MALLPIKDLGILLTSLSLRMRSLALPSTLSSVCSPEAGSLQSPKLQKQPHSLLMHFYSREESFGGQVCIRVNRGNLIAAKARGSQVDLEAHAPTAYRRERGPSGARQACLGISSDPMGVLQLGLLVLVNETTFAFPFSLLSREMQSCG